MTIDADIYEVDEESEAREERKALDEKDRHYKEMLLDGLWDQWCRTGDHDFLCLFIQRGGDIDDQPTRDLIVSLIAPKNRGGRMPMENIRFYNHVRKLMDVNGKGKTEAVKFVAEQEGISNGWDRFKAGKELENKRY